jgi:hypothetical protein
MGIYTNYTGYDYSTRYTDVEPFVGESFNYHELGIIAASEIATNHNAFMKSIALSELAAVEQTGSTDVLYESVDIKGFFDKIKNFFSKVIEKIHKIFHTFIAKMSSWFGNNEKFVKTYQKEVTDNWGKVKSDWTYKGYNYHNALHTKTTSSSLKLDVTAGSNIIKQILSDNTADALKNLVTTTAVRDNGQNNDITQDLAGLKEKLDAVRGGVRAEMITKIESGKMPTSFTIDTSPAKTLEANEFTESLYKAFRGGEDKKVEMDTKAIEQCYNSITDMMTYIKDFKTSKKNIEESEKDITGGISKLIKNINAAEDAVIKKDEKGHELVVQAASIYSDIWSDISRFETEAFSALLQANKEACAQAKEIAVKVIGLSKKMRTESYDYSTSSYDGFDFISSVKLI